MNKKKYFASLLQEQFKNEFEDASYSMAMMNISFKEWNRYYDILMRAIKYEVAKLQDIADFARNLMAASVIIVTNSEHEEYLKKLKAIDTIIYVINTLEQGQARR